MGRKSVLRGAVGVCGAMALVLALGFLTRPETSALRLGLAADGPVGLSTLRGDMGGLFALIGVFSLVAAVRGRSDYLAAPVFMVAAILVGRGLSAILDGSGAAALPLIGVEILMLGVLSWGLIGLPRRITS